MPRRFAALVRLFVLALVAALVAVGLPSSSPSPGGGGGQAKASGPPTRVRELAERRTPSMRVFELSNGQFEAELSAQPQHFQDAKGDWQPVDTTVREQSRDGYLFGNDTNAFASAFGDRTDRLARFSLAGTKVGVISTSTRIGGFGSSRRSSATRSPTPAPGTART